MRRVLVFIVFNVLGISTLFAQSNLQSPVQVSGNAGQFRLDFDISAPCAGGTTSAAGKATLCGNNNTVTLSVDGAPAFPLQPGQPGPAGPQGLPGPVGPIGATGAQGPAGPQGIAGPPGPKGATGATGSQGVAGPAGPIGATGPQGPVGPVGSAGATGPEGPEGPIGPAGPQGPPGVLGAPVDYALVTHSALAPSGSTSWAMPGAITELFGNIVRVQIDLTKAALARVYAQIGNSFGAPGAVIFCQFSTDGGTTWNTLTNNASVSNTGASLSAWTKVPSGAKKDVLVRAVSDNGTNGAVDIEAVHLQVK
jgi:hypothetical protein